MRRRSHALFFAAAALAVAACGLGITGGVADVPPAAPDDAGLQASNSVPLDGGAPTGNSAADAAPEAGDASPVVIAFEGGTPASCAAILQADPTLLGENAIAMIDPDGEGGAAPFEAYCDFVTDGGGWTLVGRSGTLVGGGVFGWSSAAGSPRDVTQPYSLGVIAAKLAFTEILVANSDVVTGAVDKYVFKFTAPAGFLGFTDTPVETLTVTSLGTACAPGGGPDNLKYAGATGLTDGFFLRDQNDLGEHRGLHPDRFDFSSANCQKAGDLTNLKGVIMVR